LRFLSVCTNTRQELVATGGTDVLEKVLQESCTNAARSYGLRLLLFSQH
jgi:hypothetical protein